MKSPFIVRVLVPVLFSGVAGCVSSASAPQPTPVPTATPQTAVTPTPAAEPQVVVTATPTPAAEPQVVVTATPTPTVVPQVVVGPAPIAAPQVVATPQPTGTPQGVEPTAPQAEPVSVTTDRLSFAADAMTQDRPQMVRGRLTGAQVQETIAKNIADVRSCYEKGLKEFAAIEGKVEVEFVVAGSGAVSRTRLVESTVGSNTVDRCLLGAVASWRFPVVRGGTVTVVRYPFLLQWESNFPELQKRLAGCWDAQLGSGGMGNIRYLSFDFNQNLARPRVMVVSERGGIRPAGARRAASPVKVVSVGLPATVRAANLRDDRLAMALSSEMFSGPMALTGTYRAPSSQFMAVLQWSGKRVPVVFQRRACDDSYVRMAGWLDSGAAPEPALSKKTVLARAKGPVKPASKRAKVRAIAKQP
jgi:TonB family protein